MNTFKELVRRTSGAITYTIEKIWALSHPSPFSTVYMVGVPRSGTTWLMSILEEAGKFRVVFEPFNPRFYPTLRRYLRRHLKPIYRPYLYLYEDDKGTREYALRVLLGHVAGLWYFSPKRMFYKNVRWLLSNRVLVKDIVTTRLLPWLAYWFKGTETWKVQYLLLVRHPCAVIESQMRVGIGNPLRVLPLKVAKKALLRDAYRIRELAPIRDEVIRLVNSITKPVEFLAALWSIDYYVPLYYARRLPIRVAIYEELALHPATALRNLLESLGLGWNSQVLAREVSRRSSTSAEAVARAVANVYKWRERITKQDVASVINTVHGFGLTFYDDRIEPDYDSLKRWKPTS